MRRFSPSAGSPPRCHRFTPSPSIIAGEAGCIQQNESMKTPSLGVMVSIGAFAGILAGIFFGEYCRVLSPIGSAYIMLLQSAVFPYLICSLRGLYRISFEI